MKIEKFCQTISFYMESWFDETKKWWMNINSCCLYRILYLSLAIHPSHPSLLISLLVSILCPNRADLTLCWSPSTGKSISKSPKENVIYEFVLISPAGHCMSCLSWMVFEMRGSCANSSCFVGCCFQDMFDTARNIFALFQSSFFFMCFFSVHLVYRYYSMEVPAV